MLWEGLLGFGFCFFFFFFWLCCLLVCLNSCSPSCSHWAPHNRLSSYPSVISFLSCWTVIYLVIPCLEAVLYLDHPCLADLLPWMFEEGLIVCFYAFIFMFNLTYFRFLKFIFEIQSLSLRRTISWFLKSPFSFWLALRVSFCYPVLRLLPALQSSSAEPLWFG